MNPLFKLSPSDLTFLWDECPRCFWLKLRLDFKRPSAPFPKIFSRIDSLMKDQYADKPLSAFSESLPAGKLYMTGKWVQSEPIELPGHTARVFIKGIFDAVLAFDAGGYGLVDFKTSEASPAHLDFYARQLRAYAYALEHPAPAQLKLSPVSRMGLLVFDPRVLLPQPEGGMALAGAVTWQECAQDQPAFLAFLDQVLSVLESPEPPAPGAECGYCQYRQRSRLNEY